MPGCILNVENVLRLKGEKAIVILNVSRSGAGDDAGRAECHPVVLHFNRGKEGYQWRILYK